MIDKHPSRQRYEERTEKLFDVDITTKSRCRQVAMPVVYFQDELLLRSALPCGKY